MPRWWACSLCKELQDREAIKACTYLRILANDPGTPRCPLAYLATESQSRRGTA